MAIYLGLGSNLGDRRANLRAALEALENQAVRIERVSPVVESPAMLPPDAPADWISPFLNLVVECSAAPAPEELLGAIKRIEYSLGRADGRHWAPRPIDIDILLYDRLQLATDALTIPHPGILQRPFVLTPLTALDPGLDLGWAGSPAGQATPLEASRMLGREIPLWMGIVNLTPDSFSDGGRNEQWPDIETTIDAMVDAGVHFLDFGAESTRPGAGPLDGDAEWDRLAPVLERVVKKFAGDALRPRISVDTYHADVARRALGLGIDMINDVGGLSDDAMVALAASSRAEFVAMHNLGLPADPAVTLPTGTSAVDQLERWIDRQLEAWRSAGIDASRVIIDPGIGFGKSALQSIELLRGSERLRSMGQRLLVGHSRKSFMKRFSGDSNADRDLVTLGVSMALCEFGVDIIRVHDVPAHMSAYRGWAHLRS